MIQYYIRISSEPSTIDDLAYRLKADYSAIVIDTLNKIEATFTPSNPTFNELQQVNERMILQTDGSVLNYEVDGFQKTLFEEISANYELKKFDFDMTGLTNAVTYTQPSTVNGKSFKILKNGADRFLLIYKGFNRNMRMIGKGETSYENRVVVDRFSGTKVYFLSNNPNLLYEGYYASVEAPILNAAHRYIPPTALGGEAEMLDPTVSYVMRFRGVRGDGKKTDWSAGEYGSAESFYMPKYNQEVEGETTPENYYYQEFEKIPLTSDIFSIVSYPTFGSNLGMTEIRFNSGESRIFQSNLSEIFSISKDAVIVNTTVMDFYRFNNDSTLYQSFKASLVAETNLNARALLEWDAINSQPPTEVDVTITRVSDTTYLVEAIGAETEANLIFKRISDGNTQVVNDATLPHTFTHTAGEVWEVSGDGGVTYVTAWGIDIPTGAYLEAQNFTDLDMANYMEVNFYYNSITNNGDGSQPLFAKSHLGNKTHRWSVAINPTTKEVSFITFGITGGGGANSQGTVGNVIDGWNNLLFESNLLDSFDLTLNGVKQSFSANPDYIAQSNDTLKFRMGQHYSGLLRRYNGIYQNYKHGTEVFPMQEGSGATTAGSEGTILNLMNGAAWIKL